MRHFLHNVLTPLHTDKMASAQAEFRRMATRSSVYLWEFLLEVLEDQELRLLCYWIDKPRREFCVKDPEEIAKLWGIMKHRPFMDKKKLLRAIRYYYTSQLITKVITIYTVYQFVVSIRSALTQRTAGRLYDWCVRVVWGYAPRKI